MAEKIMRCAVYTRKSTEDGLEQEFNSLDAQFEACAAYAASQRHEGWTLVKDRYDDGGFSGGNIDRPGLKRLLADVEAGKVDVILLYKIDRLTRSLTDFSKIVEVLDRAGASFVSITQSFNTTTSMGRLTLNMLLSFAQFEREVTGERIRDKIAASKKKGIWMGGPVPLGYDVRDRKLVVNEAEVEQVRHIMRRYLSLGTVPALVEELERDGYRTKSQVRASGPPRGGCVYRRGTLYNLLSNRIYRGMIVHKGIAYPGEHQAIVDEDLWNDVQARLAHNASGPSLRLRHRHPALLAGKVVDGEGRQMTSTHTKKNRKRYGYYVTRPDLVDGLRAWRVAAHDLEHLVGSEVARKLLEPQFRLSLLGTQIEPASLQRAAAGAESCASDIKTGTAHAKADLLQDIIGRVYLHEDRIEIALNRPATSSRLGVPIETPPTSVVTITIPAVRVRRGHQLRLIVPGPPSERPAPRCDQKLVTLVAKAHTARQLVLAHPDRPLAAIAREHGRCRTRLGKLVALSCLAPDIVSAIVEGKQPEHLTAARLQSAPLPLDWAEQRCQLGFA